MTALYSNRPKNGRPICKNGESGLKEKGKLIGAQPLNPSGKTVTGSKKIIADGPFMEGKEMVAGYLMCTADSFDEAVEISKGCPILEFEDGVVEVREIQELPPM